jgi:hypothetical protein
MFNGYDLWLVGVFPGYKGYSPAGWGISRLQEVFPGYKGP